MRRFYYVSSLIEVVRQSLTSTVTMFTIKDILFDTARLALADSRILTPKNHVPILKTATSLKDAREAVGSNNIKLHAVAGVMSTNLPPRILA